MSWIQHTNEHPALLQNKWTGDLWFNYWAVAQTKIEIKFICVITPSPVLSPLSPALPCAFVSWSEQEICKSSPKINNLTWCRGHPRLLPHGHKTGSNSGRIVPPANDAALRHHWNVFNLLHLIKLWHNLITSYTIIFL